MEWEHLFDDLEGQLAAEWEAERAALAAESERLRISKLTLRERMRIMSAGGARVGIELTTGERWDSVLRAVGADWVGVGIAGEHRLRIVPSAAITAIGADHGVLLAGLEAGMAGEGLRERMTFGFVMRDLARRRTPVTVRRTGADPQHGTIDRAGADHLDLALHDRSEPRRPRAVQGFRLIPFDAVSWVRVEGDASAAL
ncbi:hypothetical protein ACFWHT_05455 [Microbacterium sp. NPDC058342]|uniref:hypothetical protein n=1 Tax=Microbacterium sp. NPDC058342 TaxID=3346454 RepID=UPI00365F6295